MSVVRWWVSYCEIILTAAVYYVTEPLNKHCATFFGFNGSVETSFFRDILD
jgi:hypothetical protein